jgi:hypothetical protein
MRKLFSLLIMLLVVTFAFPQDAPAPQCKKKVPPHTKNLNENTNTNKNNNRNTNTNTATGGGAAINENVGSSASSAFTPMGNNTASCLQFYGLSGQGVTGGGGLGFSRANKVCQLMELANSFANHGNDVAYCKEMVVAAKKVDKHTTITFDDCKPQLPSLELSGPPVDDTKGSVKKDEIVEPPFKGLDKLYTGELLVQKSPTTSFLGFFSKIDNVAKARFDDTILRLKNHADSYITLTSDESSRHLVRQIVKYFTDAGIDSDRIVLRGNDDKDSSFHVLGVSITWSENQGETIGQ